MIYLLYGKEPLLLLKKETELLKTETIDPYDLKKYDLETDSLTTILEDAVTISMFGTKKAILVKNSYIFTGSTKHESIEQNTDLLLSYLEHPNPDTLLVFEVVSEKLDERKKIVKQIKKQGSVTELSPPKNVNGIVKEMLEDYKADPSTIQLLIDRVGTNLQILEKTCEKIKTYKDGQKLITEEDIINLTEKNIDTDIFNFIETIILNKKEEALEIYQEMLLRNEEPIKIIVMLANQFRLMYQAKELNKQGYRSSDIASILEVHPYRVKLALEKSYHFESSILLHYLEQLALLDSNIKQGFVEKGIALELFILELK